MKKNRLKNVCFLNPLPNKKFYGKVGTFLPMEKVGSGVFDLELSLPYEQMCGGYTFMRNNDVVRAIVTPCFENNKGVLLKDLNNGFAFGSTEFMCLRPKKISPKFLYYVTASEDFKRYALQSMKGVGGLKRINNKFALNYTINNYSHAQQIAIANYLDHHTAKIDKQVSLLEQQAKLLDEYKQALIYETVTKGLDKNVPMKDSGIDWIGEIPVHWEVKRVNKITKIKTGFPFNMEDGILDKLEDFLPLIKMSNFKKDSKNLKVLDNQLYFDKKLSVSSVLKKDQFIMGLSGSVENIYWHHEDEDWIVNQRIAIFYNTNRFVWYVMQSSHILQKLLLSALGTAQINLSHFDLLKVVTGIPSENERQQIAEYLDEQCLIIDKKKALINKKVELLKEYKQSLIYEAVTGKIVIGE